MEKNRRRKGRSDSVTLGAKLKEKIGTGRVKKILSRDKKVVFNVCVRQTGR